ncbi:MAG: HAMP domain-containing protein [Candidatus Omnitrophota bacterium]|nr:MAG: HAMP domain-containing protein [Candidatus Omnitrophota bacterium]
MKIANKISLSFFVISLILTTVAVYTFYVFSKNKLQETIYTHLRTASHSRGYHIETFLECQRNALIQLSQSVVFEEFLKAKKGASGYADKFNAVVSRIKKTEGISEAVCEILLLDAGGRIVGAVDRERLGLDRSQEIYFLEGKKGPYIKDVCYCKKIREMVLAVSGPVLDSKSDELLGIVVAKIKLDTLNEIITDRIGLGKTGEVQLVNESNQLIAPLLLTEEVLSKSKINTEEVKRCFEHRRKFGAEAHLEEPLLYRDHRGVEVLGIHQHIPQMPWCLLAKIDQKEAFAPLFKIRRLATTIICFVPIIAWLLGISFSKIISGPIRSLHKSTEMVGAGDLDHRISIVTRDEIGQLARAFNKMTADLKRTTTSVANLNKEIAERKQTEKRLQEAYRRLKATQFQLVQAAKMEVVGKLASGVAHEVKNPLAIILQGMEYLSQKEELRTEDILPVLKDVTEAVRRADSVIKGMLDFASLSKLNMVAENLNALLDASLLLMKHQFDRYHIQVIRDFEEGLPDVKIDRNKIEQVFVNLISNAIHSMPHGGNLTVKTHSKKMEPETAVVVEIEDTGEGIPEDILDKIFDPFFTTKRKEGGAGLGLSIVRNIVEMHNGTIEIRNREEAGVRATLVLST